MSNKTANKTASKINDVNHVGQVGHDGSIAYVAYVAYGSNLSVEQMALRCPDAAIIGTGKIRDYKLVFRFHADIEKCKGAYVPVLVWKISKSDEKRLDIYEGVAGGYYHQEKVQVLMDDDNVDNVDNINADYSGATLTGMVYVMNEQTDTELPDDYYLQIIKDGYTHFGFDKSVLEKALKEAR